LLLVLSAPHKASAQAAAQTSTIGAVTSIDAAARSLILKTDNGALVTVNLQPTANFRRVAPGETDLRNAAAIALSDITVGDRVLARGRSESQAVSAALVVVMSQNDIAKKQAADRADWDRRGVTGLVTAVAADSLTINSRTLAGTAQMMIALAPNGVLRKYAPDSVKFADAKPAKLADIRPGDQVRARGEKSSDGARMTADEIVAGTFKTIAGVVVSIDAQAAEMRVNDLETKRPVTVKVNADSSLRKLQPQVAQAVAMRVHPELAQKGAPAPGGGGDFQQMLEGSPSVTLADLKTGDAVVISSTVGAAADRVTAITLLAGVEPILRKPGTQEMSLGSWNVDFGGGLGAP
jgi:hypothetical protein